MRTRSCRTEIPDLALVIDITYSYDYAVPVGESGADPRVIRERVSAFLERQARMIAGEISIVAKATNDAIARGSMTGQRVLGDYYDAEPWELAEPSPVE